MNSDIASGISVLIAWGISVCCLVGYIMDRNARKKGGRNG
jgi:hypothetical protein